MYHIETQSDNDPRLYPAGATQGYARLCVPETWVHAAPGNQSARLSQYTYGEPLRLIARTNGYLHAQSLRDNYSGWIAENSIESREEAPNWTYLTIAIAPITAAPDLKSPCLGALPPDACLSPVTEEGDYCQLPEGGWLHRCHIASTAEYGDPVNAARSQTGRSYLWGGRGLAGLDCSALAQWAYRRAGRNIPRDSDLQAHYLQAEHKSIDPENIQRGDLLYLPGHVMLANDPYTVIHASGYHMRVVIEDLDDALRRYPNGHNRLRAYRWDSKEPYRHIFR